MVVVYACVYGTLTRTFLLPGIQSLSTLLSILELSIITDWKDTNEAKQEFTGRMESKGGQSLSVKGQAVNISGFVGSHRQPKIC